MDDIPAPLRPYVQDNQTLEARVHPRDWTNPVPTRPYHLVVMGAGTAGLVTAAGAAGLGARVALIERQLMGGDCLNTGCVPSKSLIHSARIASASGEMLRHGRDRDHMAAGFSSAMERMRRLRAEISRNDSARRFADLGVDVFFGQAEFAGNSAIRVISDRGSSVSLEFRKAVIATGARASVPDIAGLDSVPFLTNETLFSLTELPQRLAVIGGGPIGSEMAQTFARLGSQVFLFERGQRILPREDADAASIVETAMKRDGVEIVTGIAGLEVEPADGGRVHIRLTGTGVPESVMVDQLLVATGRTPNTEHLNLDAVGISCGKHGVQVNDYLQTDHPRVYAAGDVCSRYRFTHAADFMARTVIRNALFAVGRFGRTRLSDLQIPRATYTSPEIAHVGITAEAAKASGQAVDSYLQEFTDVDRAVLQGQENGFVRIITRQGTGRILGATIVAENAGEMISEITVAMAGRVDLGTISEVIHPYPTQAEAIRKIGDQFRRTQLTSMTRRVLSVLRRINVGA